MSIKDLIATIALLVVFLFFLEAAGFEKTAITLLVLIYISSTKK